MHSSVHYLSLLANHLNSLWKSICRYSRDFAAREVNLIDWRPVIRAVNETTKHVSPTEHSSRNGIVPHRSHDKNFTCFVASRDHGYLFDSTVIFKSRKTLRTSFTPTEEILLVSHTRPVLTFSHAFSLFLPLPFSRAVSIRK